MNDTAAVIAPDEAVSEATSTRSGAKVRTSITLDPGLLDKVKAASTRLAHELGKRDSVSSFIENLVRVHFEGDDK